MNTIREIGISVCITAVATAIFYGLVPHSGIERTIRFVLSVFFICCLILPFTNADFSDFESMMAYQTTDDPVGEESFQSTVNRNLEELSKQAVEETMSSLFKQEGIDLQQIQTITNVNEENSIEINEIILTVSEEDFEAAKNLSERMTDGEETVITVNAKKADYETKEE